MGKQPDDSTPVIVAHVAGSVAHGTYLLTLVRHDFGVHRCVAVRQVGSQVCVQNLATQMFRKYAKVWRHGDIVGSGIYLDGVVQSLGVARCTLAQN